MTSYKTYHPSYFLQAFGNYCSMGLFFFFFLFSFYTVQATNFYKEIPLDPINEFDEVPVEIIVKGYLRFEADVIITDTQAVYINVEELFKKLGIYIVSENEGNTFKGFIENESIQYVIDFDSRQIIRGDRIIKSENGIVKELGGIYIETSILTEAFGLNMIFNFRSLSIKLDADFELPMVKQARLEKMRENVSKLQSKNEVIIDTVIGRNYHLFNGGVVDWSVSSNQAEGEKINNRFSLGAGSELLYGEAKVAFNYYDQTKFDRRQLYYNWRWVDNDNNYIKQAQVGKIGAQSIAFLGAPLVGASFNNSPNTVRKATGTYTISEYTEPNWTVELYINDVLVDYTAADASGLYVFKVPIVYGYTTLKLKFFGPLGEERFEERTMNTPYTFMPAGKLEYNVSGGILEDGDGSKFGRGEVNYGINRVLTIGGGVEYLSNLSENPTIPFANLAFQPFSKMVINMEYAHNVSVKGLLNYYFGKSAFLEVDYTNFVEGQQVTLNNTNEERKIRLSLPYKLNKISGNTKFSFNQYVYDNFDFNQFDAVFSGRYKNYSANASLASNWVSDRDPYLTATLALSHRLKRGLTIRPTIQYNITDGTIMRYRAEIEKRVSKMSFSASYERNVQYKTNNLFFSFKYDLPFARTGFTSSYTNNSFNFSENAQGSLGFGGDNGYVHAGNNSALGKGGILLYPYLDLNQNGKRDKGEKMIWINKVKVSGGKAITSEKDSIIRISDLNAFINYNVEFSDTNLDNIAWKFKNRTYQILVDPNQYKKVEVPVVVMGEVNGTVDLNKEGNIKGQGRITVQIYNSQNQKVAETLSESDGYFSYLGLKPGNYTIRIDEQQLQKLNYQVTPAIHSFKIEQSEEGTIIEGVTFNISEKLSDENRVELLKQEVSNSKIEEPAINNENKDNADPSYGKISDIKGTFYGVQIGVYKTHVAPNQLKNLKPIYYEILPNGDILYVYGSYSTKQEAVNVKNGLLLRDNNKMYVVSYSNGIKVGDYPSLELSKISDANVLKNTTNEIHPLHKIDTSFSKISEIEGSFYSVQIGVFRKKVIPSQLLNLTPIYYEVLPDKTARYIAGKYELKKEAKIAKNSIVAKGIKDAYVVAYQNGEKISVYELEKIQKGEKLNFGNIVGSVQFKDEALNIELSNLKIQLWSNEDILIEEVTADNNGNFSFNKLKPGVYKVQLASDQLEKLGYKAVPLAHKILIKIADAKNTIKGLDFTIIKSKE